MDLYARTLEEIQKGDKVAIFENKQLLVFTVKGTEGGNIVETNDLEISPNSEGHFMVLK